MKTVKYLYVYILKCADGTYYTGVTNDVERRLQQHNKGINPKSYTFKRRPLSLVYSERFSDFNQAIAWEKKVKDWSTAKKEALISGDWKRLKMEAECRNSTSHKSTSRLRLPA